MTTNRRTRGALHLAFIAILGALRQTLRFNFMIGIRFWAWALSLALK
jgi:hypothetical protein